MYWIAWKATGGKGDFESFLDDLVDVQIAGANDRPLSDSQ
jgi:hypothetical protein